MGYPDIRLVIFWQVVPVELPNTTDSYYAYAQRAIVADIKESVCRVPDSAFDGNFSSFWLFLLKAANMLVYWG
jgi:hypothetical protein